MSKPMEREISIVARITQSANHIGPKGKHFMMTKNNCDVRSNENHKKEARSQSNRRLTTTQISREGNQ